jgi:hypothetical protein
MATRSSYPTLLDWLISQYEMPKHLCDRLTYANSSGWDNRKLIARQV